MSFWNSLNDTPQVSSTQIGTQSVPETYPGLLVSRSSTGQALPRCFQQLIYCFRGALRCRIRCKSRDPVISTEWQLHLLHLYST